MKEKEKKGIAYSGFFDVLKSNKKLKIKHLEALAALGHSYHHRSPWNSTLRALEGQSQPTEQYCPAVRFGRSLRGLCLNLHSGHSCLSPHLTNEERPVCKVAHGFLSPYKF